MLDHHKTAIVALEEHAKRKGPLPANVTLRLNLLQSGATIAWDYWTQIKRADFSPEHIGISSASYNLYYGFFHNCILHFSPLTFLTCKKIGFHIISLSVPFSTIAGHNAV